MIWVGFGSVGIVLVVFVVMGLLHLSRHSDRMKTSQVVMWAALIVLVPFIGLIGYLFWQLEHSEAMAGAMTGRRGEAAPFLQDPSFRDD